MNYKMYKLSFKTAVHFGNRSLENSEFSFCADTLFSALCHEAVKMGQEKLAELYDLVTNDSILLSDAFPYIRNTFYLPKPMKRIQSEKSEEGNSIIKKAYKKLKYISIDEIDSYLNGTYDVLSADNLGKLGDYCRKTQAAIRGYEETVPYRVGGFQFRKGNGLYVIVGYEHEAAAKFVDDLMYGVSFCGIGGKRSSGYGRFDLEHVPIHPLLEKRLHKSGDSYMTLSIALPTHNELSSVIEDAEYLLVKRSGFVLSDSYFNVQMRKRDLYVFKCGSCFTTMFKGDVFDVSDSSGYHPVYRYAKPMFMEVDA